MVKTIQTIMFINILVINYIVLLGFHSFKQHIFQHLPAILKVLALCYSFSHIWLTKNRKTAENLTKVFYTAQCQIVPKETNPVTCPWDVLSLKKWSEPHKQI